jgi:hypothetical protein
VKQGLGIHVPITEAIFKKCEMSNPSTYPRTKKNNTKHTHDLTFSWFTSAYAQTGNENLILQQRIETTMV